MGPHYKPHALKHLGPLEEFMVISDIHLRDPKSPLSDLFLTFLAQARSCKALFLLGDIFDFIFVGKDHFIKKWEPVWSALRELKSQGTAIYFIEGNHDFGFEHFPPGTLSQCFTACGDFDVLVEHPHLGTIALSHGDRLVSPWHYPHFRRIVKSKLFQKLALCIPGNFMDSLFSRLASLSRSQDTYRTLDTNFLGQRAHLMGVSYGAKTVILGHVHLHTNGHVGPIHVLTGTDWPQCPNVLMVEAGGGNRRWALGKTPLPPPETLVDGPKVPHRAPSPE